MTDRSAIERLIEHYATYLGTTQLGTDARAELARLLEFAWHKGDCNTKKSIGNRKCTCGYNDFMVDLKTGRARFGRKEGEW